MEGLDPLVAKYVLDYTPVNIPADDWAVIGDFVREAVLDAQPDRKHTAKVWLYSLAYFVHWCWGTCRLPLDRQVIFQPPHISRYVAEQMDAKGSSRATVRSKLRYIAAALNVQAEGEDYEYESFGRRKGSVPYTAQELADIRVYAQATGTPRKKDTLTALMALGCGAGLRPNELLLIEKDDIEFTEAGITVIVGGEFPRRVPLLRSFEDLAYRTWEASDGGYLVLPNVTKRGPMVVANFLYTCPNSPLRPHMQRLRSTWIVEQLNARVPFPVIQRAAGVASLSAFDRYLPYVNRTEDGDADELLRVGVRRD